MVAPPHPTRGSRSALTRREFLKLGLAGLLAGAYPLLDLPLPQPPSSWPGQFSWRARRAYTALLDQFSTPKRDQFFEYIRPVGSLATLWPFLGVVSATQALARADERYLPEAERLLAGLQAYLDPGANPPGYASSLAGGQKYYDDNAWAGWAFVEAYRLFGEDHYLDQAILSLRFALSGWSEALGGGIYWRQGDFETKNTCSNAPTAVLALQVYQETRQPEYFDWAFRILAWLDRLKCPTTGLYFDSLSASNQIDRRFFSYNTGAPLYVHALFYSLTGEDTHLTAARQLARAAQTRFLQPGLPATPWFNAILLQGCLALAEVDPEPDLACLAGFSSSLDHAWRQARDESGLLHPDWAAGSPPGSNRLWLLDQAGAVECLARLASFAVPGQTI